MKLKVYKNSRRKCFSAIGSNGRIENYYYTIALKNCTFHVQPRGMEKVLKTKQKNVHAYVKGEKTKQKIPKNDLKRFWYNPYLHDTFVDLETGEPISEADYVLFDYPYCFACYGK